MKRHVFTIMFSLICLFGFAVNTAMALDLDGEVVYEGDYIIHSNESLWAFKDYTIVTGNLEIRGNANFLIASMTHFLSLRKVGGNLWVYEIGLPTGLTGLNNLTSVGGDVLLRGMIAVNDLSGLNNLSHVGGNFRIQYSPDLRTTRGLESLTSVGGDLLIFGYRKPLLRWESGTIYSLSGLRNIESVGGRIEINDTDVISIEFDNLVTTGCLLVFNNPSLTQIQCNSLITINGLPTGYGGLRVIENPELTELGFDSLEYVKDCFGVVNNEKLPTDMVVELSENITIDGIIAIEGNLE